MQQFDYDGVFYIQMGMLQLLKNPVQMLEDGSNIWDEPARFHPSVKQWLDDNSCRGGDNSITGVPPMIGIFALNDSSEASHHSGLGGFV